MKNLLITPLLFTMMILMSSCSGLPWECGPFPEGYSWEKKDHVFMVPSYPDSLASDTIMIWVLSYGEALPSIVYSPVLDSFKITSDISGKNFWTAGADTMWKPTHEYRWAEKELLLDYWFTPNHNQTKSSQSPQCTPAPDDQVYVTKMKIEAPKTIKFVKVIPY